MSATLSLPVLPARRRHVVVLPGYRFFVRSVPVATGTDLTAIRSEIELALEAMSPFPLSQLYWGYWTKAGCGRALVYGAYRRRFAAEELEHWGDAEWVAPRLGALLAGRAPEPATVWVLQGSGEITALYFGDTSGVPTVVRSVPVAEDLSEPDLETARRDLIRQCGDARLVVDIEKLEIDAGSPGDNELIISRDGRTTRLGLDEAQMLDVRDPAELAARRRARVRDSWMWRIWVASLIVILLAGIGEGSVYATEFWQQGRMAQIAQQTPLVSEIETADRLANRIEELKTKRMRPFEMIGLVDGPRPDSIIFLETAAIGLYSLQIEAITDSLNDVNVYISALTDLAGTESVEMLDLETRGSQSTTRLLVVFTADAFDLRLNPEAQP
jgi:hypothetical protein